MKKLTPITTRIPGSGASKSRTTTPTKKTLSRITTNRIPSRTAGKGGYVPDAPVTGTVLPTRESWKTGTQIREQFKTSKIAPIGKRLPANPPRKKPTLGSNPINNTDNESNDNSNSNNVANNESQESNNGSSNPPQYLPKPDESGSNNGGNNNPAGFLGDLANAAGDALENAGEVAGDTANDLVDAANDVANGFSESPAAGAEAAVDGAVEVTTGGVNFAGNVAAGIAKGKVGLASKVADAVLPNGSAKDLKDQAAAGAKDGINALEDFGTGVASGVIKGGGGITKSYVRTGEKAGQWAAEQSGKVNDLNNDIINSIGGESDSGTGTTNSNNPFENVVEAGKKSAEAVGKTGQYFTESTGKIVEKGQQAGKWATDKATDAVGTIAEDPIGFGNNLKDAAQRGAQQTQGKVGQFIWENIEQAFDAGVAASGNDPESTKEVILDRAAKINDDLEIIREFADDPQAQAEFAEDMAKRLSNLPRTSGKNVIDLAETVFETGVTAAGGDAESARENAIEAGQNFFGGIGQARENANTAGKNTTAKLLQTIAKIKGSTDKSTSEKDDGKDKD